LDRKRPANKKNATDRSHTTCCSAVESRRSTQHTGYRQEASLRSAAESNSRILSEQGTVSNGEKKEKKSSTSAGEEKGSSKSFQPKVEYRKIRGDLDEVP